MRCIVERRWFMRCIYQVQYTGDPLGVKNQWTIIADSHIRSLYAGISRVSATSRTVNVAFGDADGVYVHQFVAIPCNMVSNGFCDPLSRSLAGCSSALITSSNRSTTAKAGFKSRESYSLRGARLDSRSAFTPRPMCAQSENCHERV